jgi:outer membrane protein assembly factor BamA
VRGLGFLGVKRYFNETQFRSDVYRILALYRRSGYREATVDTVVARSNGDVNLRFIIDEGDPIRVTAFEIEGIEEDVDMRKLRRRLPLQIGDPFNLVWLQMSTDTISSVLKNEGYPFPEIFVNFAVDREEKTANVSLEVVPGDKATIDAVEITGTRKIDNDVVRRAISVKPGDRYSEQKLQRSESDLYRLSLFNFANVALLDSVPGEGQDTTVTVGVRVSEARLRRIRLGGGYGTIDCFRVIGSWTVYNFLGAARTLELSTQFSKLGAGSPTDLGFSNGICPALAQEEDNLRKLNYNVSMSLSEPFFLSRRTSATLTFGAEQFTEYRAYLRQSIGGAFSVTWRPPFDVPITGSYALGRAKTEADPASFCAFLDVCRIDDAEVFTEPRFRATIGLGLVWDRSNSILNPSRGTRLSMEFRHADDFLGSDSLIQFTRGVVEFASFHRVGRRSVLAWRLRLGAVGAPRVGSESGERRFIPSEDRMYGGGPNSVRGYAQNELGPLVRVLETTVIDSTSTRMEVDSVIRTSALGGDQLILANLEWRFPMPILSDRLVGAVFVDAGQVVERSDTTSSLSDIRVTPGVGFRVATGLGPIRLDVGYNGYDARPSPLYELVVDEDNQLQLVVIDESYQPERRGFLSRLRLHFSVGQAF